MQSYSSHLHTTNGWGVSLVERSRFFEPVLTIVELDLLILRVPPPFTPLPSFLNIIGRMWIACVTVNHILPPRIFQPFTVLTNYRLNDMFIRDPPPPVSPLNTAVRGLIVLERSSIFILFIFRRKYTQNHCVCQSPSFNHKKSNFKGPMFIKGYPLPSPFTAPSTTVWACGTTVLVNSRVTTT